MTDKQSDGVLPALPEPANEDCWSGDCHWPEGFTADQMRDYARTAVAAALAAQKAAPAGEACQSCGGSGEQMHLSGGGPDAYEVLGPCNQCSGTGDAPAQSVTLKQRLDELTERHGSLRAVARVLDFDAGYLSRLASGEKTDPGETLLRRMGLREITTYERLGKTTGATLASTPVPQGSRRVVCPTCNQPPISDCAFANCKREFAATPTEPSTPTEREAEQAEAPSSTQDDNMDDPNMHAYGDHLQNTVEDILRDVCELEPANPSLNDTVCIDISDLKIILDRHIVAIQPTASNAGERVHGFDRDELQDVATGLEDGYSGSVNVGADGERLESTNSYAARFIRAALATKPPAGEQKPAGELVGYQLSDGDGPDWHLRLFTKFAADEHVSAGGKVRALYAGPLPQDRQPLGPENRRRIILGALSIGAAIDMVEATHGIFGAARARGEGERND